MRFQTDGNYGDLLSAKFIEDIALDDHHKMRASSPHSTCLHEAPFERRSPVSLPLSHPLANIPPLPPDWYQAWAEPSLQRQPPTPGKGEAKVAATGTCSQPPLRTRLPRRDSMLSVGPGWSFCPPRRCSKNPSVTPGTADEGRKSLWWGIHALFDLAGEVTPGDFRSTLLELFVGPKGSNGDHVRAETHVFGDLLRASNH